MLIITSDVANLTERAEALRAWPGPHIILLDPDHGLEEPALAALETGFVLYDLADREVCQLNLLRKTLLHAVARGWTPSGPFLFLRGDLDDERLSALTEEVKTAPAEMRFEGADDEDALSAGAFDLSLLLIGAEISENPLIMTFFRNMEADLGPAHSRASLNLLKEHLV